MNKIELIIYCLITIIACFVFGPNTILFLIPVLLYYFVRLSIDFIKAVKNKFQGKEDIFQRLLSGVSVCTIIVIGYKYHVYYGQMNFRKAVAKIIKYREAKGDYPTSLSDVGIDRNPYLSLAGPNLYYKYLPGDQNLKFPIFYLVEISPFNRFFYNFENNKEGYIN